MRILDNHDVKRRARTTIIPDLPTSQSPFLPYTRKFIVNCSFTNTTIMSYFRPMSMLRSAALRPAALSAAPRARVQVRFATQDYGSGQGNPVGEAPQKQGENPSENLEHPGPEPPSVAKGKSSSSPNKDSNAGQNDSPQPTSQSPAPSSSNGSSGQRKFSTWSRRMQDSKEPAVKQGQQNEPDASEVKGAKPKILNENPPAAGNESEEVRKHNEDMSNRAEQAHERVSNEEAKKDKVPVSFWKGTSLISPCIECIANNYTGEGGRGDSEGVRG